MNEQVTLKKAVPWQFFIATVGMMVAMNMAGIYLVFYMTERMEIAVVVVGSVMMASRIVDLIIALVCGAIVQKNCFKLGQYRTWLFYGPIVLALGTVLMFLNPALPVMAKAVVVFIGFVMYGGAASFMQISQNGLMAKIAGTNMQNRLAISAKIAQGQQMATIICSFLTLPLINMIESNSSLDGYTIVQIIYSISCVLMSLLLFSGAKEYDPYDPDFKSKGAGSSVKLGTMISRTFRNGQFLILLLADAFRFSAFLSLMALGSYYFTYVVGDISLFTMSLIAQSFTGFIGSFVAPQISRRIGKRNSGLVTAAICTATYVCLGLFAQGNNVLFMIFNCIGFFGLAIVNSCGVNLYLDAAEYQLYKTGDDNRTFTMSMFGTSIKLGNIASSVIVTALLTAAGYDEVAKVFSNVSRFGMLVGIVPACFFLAYGICIFTFKITEEKSREYAAHNFERAQKLKAEKEAETAKA